MSTDNLDDLLGTLPGLNLPSDNGGGGFSVGANNAGVTAPSGPSNQDLADMQRRIEEQQRKIDELERRPLLPNDRQGAPIPTSIAPNISPQEAKAQLEAAYIQDPIGFLTAYGQTLSQQLEARLLKSNLPMQNAIASNGVSAFKGRIASDPMFKMVEPEFDRLVGAELQNLTPDNLDAKLDALYSTAYGDTLRKRPAGGRENLPPNYGGGTSVGGSADSGLRADRGGKNFSEEDRIYVETMRDAGFDDKKILELMKAREA